MSLREWLISTYQSAGRLVLLFDYDGTLVPHTPHPELAVLDRRTRRVLDGLSRQTRIFVGVVSGRSLEELRGMVGLENVYYAGLSGLELDLRGTRIQHPAATKAIVGVNRLLEQLEAILPDFPQAWLENKRFGATVHFRDLRPQLVPDLRNRLGRVVQAGAEPLRIVDGPMAFEIVPPAGCHKGIAVQALIQYLGACGPASLYAGDDASDAEAFSAVKSRGGTSIGVGSEAPATADLLFESPRELIENLDDLLQEFRRMSRIVRHTAETGSFEWDQLDFDE